MNKFIFIDYDEQTIQNKRFLCIYVLDFKTKTVFRIFKPYTDDLYDKYAELESFSDITHYINFVIKRDGKISLDISL